MKTSRMLLLLLLMAFANLVLGQEWKRAPEYIIFMGKTYNKATLFYENGQNIGGYVAIPKTCGQDEISFKPFKDSKAITVPSKMLKRIMVYNKDSTTYSFERVNYVLEQDDPPKRNGWLYVMVEGYATLYFKVDKYKIDKEGKLLLIAEEGMPMNFVQKKSEHKAVLVATSNPHGSNMVIGSEKPFKKYAPVAFAEDQELVSKIKKGQYKSRDIEEVVKIYNQYMENKY